MTDLPLEQVRTLLAVVDEGTFDAAAAALHVTPSAVSQRVKALEQRTGRVLLQRTKPVRPTESGAVLVRFARQLARLERDAWGELGLNGTGEPTRVSVAVNADSLATWFRTVAAEVAGWDDVALRLHVEDQAFSAGLLRSGGVLAAVTSDPVAVQGCSVERLGVLRYVPAATPVLAEQFRRGRGPDWAAMPVVVFNEKDALQHDVLAARGVAAPPVVHRVPTSADFLEAVCLGLGWGMIPEPQLGPMVERGRLEPLVGRLHVDVPLHWQRWRLDSPVLDRLTDAVRRAATVLRDP
jgi:LysR family transcriptional regulator (chromosome initiation inhibitor)